MNGSASRDDEAHSHRTPRTLVSRILSPARMAVTELLCDTPNWGMTAQIKPEDAFVITLELRDYFGDIWLDGKYKNVVPIRRGQVAVYDLKVDTRAYLRSTFHCLQIYLPTSGINSLLANSGQTFDRNLNCALASAIDDAAWMQITSLIMPALRVPEQANNLFLDYLSLALAAHFAARYGGRSMSLAGASGGLSSRQLRLAKDLIMNRLDGGITISELADACGLTSGHFSRAFKQSTGLPPHRWLLVKRVEQAQAFMKSTEMTLLEISLACGFVDQSHFQRVFTRFYGITPKAWRSQQVRLTPQSF